MTEYLLFIAIVFIICIIGNKISNKIGMPMLLVFIILGMIFGTDGIFKIQFDDYLLAEQICSVALIFIMFYGGFGTKWKVAKPVIKHAVVLSSLGTVLTALLVGLFCHFILQIELLESFLIGSVISSTDAASVFSILRFKKLNLKYNTASLLEIESGSNDPFSYMLTIVVLALMNGQTSSSEFVLLLISQVVLGIGFGFIIAKGALYFIKKVEISASGFSSIFFLAIATLSYALPTLLNGNGYLSVYITGIILGNSALENKKELVHFFDGTTGLMQMVLFFLLGLLAFPLELTNVFGIALAISLFLTIIARPVVVHLLLYFFKCPLNQKLLVSWSGMRGAASIVFAIMVVINPVVTNHDIFHIVFFIVLFSILIQGSLIPLVASKLNMIDHNSNVMRTFNDYEEDNPVDFLQLNVTASHPWINSEVKSIIFPPDTLIVLILREGTTIIPDGSTIINQDDTIILAGKSMKKQTDGYLFEVEINDDLVNHKLKNSPYREALVVMIKRNKKAIIPKGSTVLKQDDILVIVNNSKIK